MGKTLHLAHAERIINEPHRPKPHHHKPNRFVFLRVLWCGHHATAWANDKSVYPPYGYAGALIIPQIVHPPYHLPRPSNPSVICLRAHIGETMNIPNLSPHWRIHVWRGWRGCNLCVDLNQFHPEFDVPNIVFAIFLFRVGEFCLRCGRCWLQTGAKIAL